MITVEEVQSMQARAEKVTPGPWGSPTANIGRVIAWFEQEQPDGTKRWQPRVGIVEGDAEHFWFGKDDIRYPQTDEGSAQRCADIGFICSARTDLPRLAADWLAQREELEAARAVVARLPKTADGVPMTPDMVLWRTEIRVPGKAHSVNRFGANVGSEPHEVWCADYCYSKESLAVAAREAAALAAAASPKSGGGEG